MKPFLAEVAEHIYNNYSQELGNCCLVFPNRRAAVFFTKHLGNLVDKPIWLPRMVNINEFIIELSGLQVADNLLLNFELYKIYNRHSKSKESFDVFYPWGETLLSDFDDIDKYLVNPHDLFQNLSSLKDIESTFDYLTEEQKELIKKFWGSINSSRLSNEQKDFVEIWAILEQIYMEFTILLNEKSLAYEGMVYRKVVEQIETGKELQTDYLKIFFVGFNALNKCEFKLFNYFKQVHKADFYWDYDQYYMDVLHHEAGTFIRDNIQHFPSSLDSDIFTNLLKEKKIESISTASKIGMVKATGNILKGYFAQGGEADFTNTAIVLADESLLLPVLHSIPDRINRINITMGYPIVQSPVYSLLETIFNLQRTARNTDNEPVFYHSHVIEIMDHPLFSRSELCEQVKQDIVKANMIYVSASWLKKKGMNQIVFKAIDGAEKLGSYLQEVILSLMNPVDENKNDNDNLNQEFLYHMLTSIKRLNDILREHNIQLKLDTYIKLLRQIAKGIRIPFSGEPLAGLQIMGILETRVLDFENIIILSANEGILPKASLVPSFIPYNLRKGFGLSSVDHQDSIYAYYFYRLLQRAKNVKLLYNSSAEGVNSGEMSRFIYQLKYEDAFYLQESTMTYDLMLSPSKPIIVEKSKEVMDEFLRYEVTASNGRYLSPSAINQYLDCSLRFYFNYIAGLSETETVSEEIDAPLFGNILHKTMSLLYRQFVCRLVKEEDLTALKSDKLLIKNTVIQAFAEEYYQKTQIDENDLTGINLIVKEILEKYIEQIIDADIRYAPFEITSLEQLYKTHLTVTVNGTTTKISIGGKIDRVDRKEGITRVIDYKTGKVDKTVLELENLFAINASRRKDAILQILLYSMLYADNEVGITHVIPGIYSLRELYDQNFDYQIKTSNKNIEDFSEVSEEFKNRLEKAVSSIFDASMPFSQTPHQTICEYCAYKEICNR